MDEPVLKIYWLSKLCFSARQWQTGLPLTANLRLIKINNAQVVENLSKQAKL